MLSDVAQLVDISYDFGRQVRGDHVVAEALRSALGAQKDVGGYNEHLHAAWQLVKSSRQALSIDNVLDALEDPKASLVGKAGIVRSILASEGKLDLSGWVEHFPDQIKIQSYSDTWLDRLVKLLTENVRKSEIGDIFNNFALINFNYDRIVEQYLPFAIAEYYGVPVQDIRELYSSVPVFRPYGKAGSLEWEKGSETVRFGHDGSGDTQSAMSQILTFTEQVEDKDLVSGIHGVISAADRIVFLGFGYHRPNLKVLSARAQPHVQILGTSFGMSKSDQAVVCDELEDVFGLSEIPVLKDGGFVSLHPLKCSEFMGEIWRTLTAEPRESPAMFEPHSLESSYPELPNFGGFSR
ncbi:MAG: hypothetical protein ABJ205_07770 [Erythrobacter sp.]|uniref:hypothetical protein n=1 Tax=Erythrobacter sp. TaxID=1042 RepID=UPI0032647B59